MDESLLLNWWRSSVLLSQQYVKTWISCTGSRSYVGRMEVPSCSSPPLRNRLLNNDKAVTWLRSKLSHERRHLSSLMGTPSFSIVVQRQSVWCHTCVIFKI